MVRAGCEAQVLAAAPPAAGVGPCMEKYRAGRTRIGLDPNGFAWAYSAAARATPTRWQV